MRAVLGSFELVAEDVEGRLYIHRHRSFSFVAQMRLPADTVAPWSVAPNSDRS